MPCFEFCFSPHSFLRTYLTTHRSPTTAADTVKNHIRLLHEYNEIRDIGTGLMGIIADNRGVQLKEVYPDFGVDVDD